MSLFSPTTLPASPLTLFILTKVSFSTLFLPFNRSSSTFPSQTLVPLQSFTFSSVFLTHFNLFSLFFLFPTLYFSYLFQAFLFLITSSNSLQYIFSIKAVFCLSFFLTNVTPYFLSPYVSLNPFIFLHLKIFYSNNCIQSDSASILILFFPLSYLSPHLFLIPCFLPPSVFCLVHPHHPSSSSYSSLFSSLPSNSHLKCSLLVKTRVDKEHLQWGRSNRCVNLHTAHSVCVCVLMMVGSVEVTGAG